MIKFEGFIMRTTAPILALAMPCVLMLSCSDASRGTASSAGSGNGGASSATGGASSAMGGTSSTTGGTSSGGATSSGGSAGASGPTRSCKRGVAYGYHSVADLTALSRGIGWWYNWATRPDTDVRSSYASIGVEFVPMVWGGNFDVDTVVGQIPGGAKYLLGFNEPNYGSQANLTVSQAVALWPSLEQIAQRKNLKLVSPAVNFCGGDCNQTDPIVYLDQFFAACTNCQIDYVAAHWYACTGDALKWYLSQLEKYNRPIWITEFACGDDADRSLAVQKAYMQQAVQILEANPRVFRYAWFSGRTTAIPNVNLLGDSGQLTELGQLYVSLPFSKSACP
jgi:hypothetical protein